MLTGAVVRKRAMVVVGLALPAIALATGNTAAAGLGRSCATETLMWTGTAMFDAATTAVTTDLVVPVVAGTELTVVGVSADGLAPDGVARAMGVTIGDVAATPGAAVSGGAVTIVGDGSPAVVRGATVVVDRCAAVQVAPQAPASPTGLPHTGVGLDSALLGTLAIVAGTAMIVAGRRRADA